MEIIHQLNFNSKKVPKLLRILQSSEIKLSVVDLPNQEGQSIRVMVSESSPFWPSVQPYLEIKEVLHSYETFFTESEILGAEWIRVVNVYEQGYPQPEHTWITNPVNYGEFCRACGVYKQTEPFRISKEPSLRKIDFMSLIWTGDTLFTTSEVINILKENDIKGFETWDVIIQKGAGIAKSIFQLFIPNLTLPGLAEEMCLNKTVCTRCRVEKYDYHRYGKMVYQGNSLPTGFDIIRTNEWFGSGHLAFQEIFISNKLARLIIKNKWKGFLMKPILVI